MPMKIVAGVDWSDESFAAVEQLGLLYRPQELMLVHGVDLGFFEYPIVAEAANLEGYDVFRKAMFDAGCQALDRATKMLPPDCPAPRTLCEFRKPAPFILDAAAAIDADLVVVGTHDHSRAAELVLSSVSHRVLLNAKSATLVVKGKPRPAARVLLAVEGPDDAARLCEWVTAHPFKTRVEYTVLSVAPALTMMEPHLVVGFQAWSEESLRYAERLAGDTAGKLTGPSSKATALAKTGDPVAVISECSRTHDITVVGSHGRNAFDRLLLGSVSHGVVHRASGPVLVIR